MSKSKRDDFSLISILMKRTGGPQPAGKKVVLVASDAVSGNGDEALPATSVARNIGLLPILCSSQTTEARVANPMHLLSMFFGVQPQTLQGFGADNAVVVPLTTHFQNPRCDPKKKLPHTGAAATILYADAFLEDGELFVAAKDAKSQVKEEMAWLASRNRSGRVVSMPVLLPVTTKRFLCPSDLRFESMLRPSSAARAALGLVSDGSGDGGETFFASRWDRLVSLFSSEADEPALASRMCDILGIPMDRSGLVMAVWPISMAEISRVSTASTGSSIGAASASRMSMMTAPKWRLAHAYLPLWFLPVFLAAANDISGNEVHDVQQALMQITGQLSVLSSYDNPSKLYAAAALDRLFAVVRHIKTDTAMHLVNAAFSVGPVLSAMARDRERLAALEAEKETADERISALERQVASLLEVTEALFRQLNGDFDQQ